MNNNQNSYLQIGYELVHILQQNTNLSHTTCTKSVIDIINHLNKSLPEFSTNGLVDTIQTSILENENYNPDIQNFTSNLKLLFDIKCDLETGNRNFYELNKNIESILNNLSEIPVKSFPNVFANILEYNRDVVISLIDLYNYCAASRDIRFKIVLLLYDYIPVDTTLIDVLFANTNFIEEICCSIKEFLKLKDFQNLELSCRFLLLIMVNRKELTIKYQNFLKENNFLDIVYESIENDSYLHELNIFDTKTTKRINQHNKTDTINDLLTCIVVSINNFYLTPNENIVLNKFLIYNKNHSNSNLLESLLKFFNFEEEPLKSFKLLKFDQDFYISNSIIKMFNDIFSISQHSNSIFYLSDFQVIVDIIIRKLSNLSFEDQIRMDYISLIDLIIKNTDYLSMNYRFDELKECFQSIIKEKTETYDQDIIRALVVSYPIFS